MTVQTSLRNGFAPGGESGPLFPLRKVILRNPICVHTHPLHRRGSSSPLHTRSHTRIAPGAGRLWPHFQGHRDGAPRRGPCLIWAIERIPQGSIVCRSRERVDPANNALCQLLQSSPCFIHYDNPVKIHFPFIASKTKQSQELRLPVFIRLPLRSAA